MVRLRIFGVIFVAFDNFYPFRVSNYDIDFILKKIKDRNSVFTRRFHADIMTIVF